MPFQNGWTGRGAAFRPGVLKEGAGWKSEEGCLPGFMVVFLSISLRTQGDCGTRHTTVKSTWVVALHLDLEKSAQVVSSQ